MNIYFDTNIYGFISDKQEGQAVRNFLDKSEYSVQASSENLLELYAIPDRDKCIAQLETLTSVAASFEPKPQSWLQAKEVVSEIEKYRPYWIRQPHSKKLILQEKEFIRGHISDWDMAKHAHIPPLSVQAAYRKDFEGGVKKSTQSQKALKQRLLDNNLEVSLVFQTKHGEITEIYEDEFLEPDLFWRVDCLLVWYEAIVRRMPESRDYVDWLIPYVKDAAFKSHSYPDFWIKQVRANKVAKNRISSLVSFYQIKHKVTHGNPNDQIHACYMLDVDVFVTADKTFYKVLTKVKTHFRNCAELIFLNRGASSALDELTNSLDAIRIKP